MTDDIPYLDLSDRTFSTRSEAVLEARSAGWCARTPWGLAVLRHRQAGRLLRDRRLRQGSRAWPDKMGLEGSFADFWRRSVIGQEGIKHKRLRDIAGQALSSEAVARLRPEFEAAAARLAEQLVQKTHAEFMSEFALPYAGQAIAVLLGLRPDQWGEIAEDAADLGRVMGLDAKQNEARANAACDRLLALADDLIARASCGDGEGFVSQIIDSNADGIPRAALRDLTVITIFGGVDTTKAQLGNLIALFAEHPAEWNALRRDASLIPAAIEEGIRCRPTTTWVTREAVESFEFEGQEITAGMTLSFLVHATATDPAVYDPPEFSLSATRKLQFGFGLGSHNCMGQVVARADIAIALGALRKTFATLRLDGPPDWLPESGNTGPVRLPIAYEPDR